LYQGAIRQHRPQGGGQIARQGQARRALGRCPVWVPVSWDFFNV
jgi:hypothetical protein